MTNVKTGLPFPDKKAENLNPKLFLLFGKPKTGKTTIVSQLDHSLLIELEPGGADFISGSVVQVDSLNKLREVGVKIKEYGKPYKYVVIDTVTKLEDLVLPYAAQLYKQTPMGKNWTGKDVKILPKGAGYYYLRKAFFAVIDEIQTWAENVVLIGHLKDNLIEKEGEEFTSKEIDLTGKIKGLLSAQSDAIAYFYRKGPEGFLNFEPSEDVTAGCRSPHLEGKTIKVSEKTDDGVKVSWKEIYKF